MPAHIAQTNTVFSLASKRNLTLRFCFCLPLQTDGPDYTPLTAIENSFDQLLLEFQQIDQRFEEEVSKFKAKEGDVFE